MKKAKDILYLAASPIVSAWAIIRAGFALQSLSLRSISSAAGYLALAILIPACALLVYSLSSLYHGKDLERYSKWAETAARLCKFCAAVWGLSFLAPSIIALTQGITSAAFWSLLARTAILGFILPISFRAAEYIRSYLHETYYVA